MELGSLEEKKLRNGRKGYFVDGIGEPGGKKITQRAQRIFC
jgi:hypothetical protein